MSRVSDRDNYRRPVESNVLGICNYPLAICIDLHDKEELAENFSSNKSPKSGEFVTKSKSAK